MNDFSFSLDPLLRRVLEEDIGPGDITTEALIEPDSQGSAILIAKEELVLAGLKVFNRVFELLSPDIRMEPYHRDGDRVQGGEKVCRLKGGIRGILMGERTALNLLQRMSGIATLTHRFVERAGSSKVRVTDTRKTVPGLRYLDKYAVRMGGGYNHRMGLYDGVLIKDNHIAAAGSIGRAVELARAGIPHTLKIEVEVEDLAGLKEAIQAGADAVLLDNMSVEQMREAVKIAGGKVLVEASGGIDLDSIGEVAGTGVDIISVGALTHSVRAVDLSLELEQVAS
ncbi:MAG: carboxylating nicotinate-nucleotide diphosphorylase [Deltaproteobacteria bacterium]|nr:carboxylating nicotinate-nucleotide diphosphorylase [Deltaproteobacteria bacterium]MBW2130150.1 carboxylating nicotinate-nucleotide diphosphorylase [Deltaproteobacteria bacterium]MBW2303603.1 carboxylating nicotinate-nucleotide diphosphorylase [Deltaproteobacteria bacterium]